MLVLLGVNLYNQDMDEDTNMEGQTFREWMAAVDKWILEFTQCVTSDDLADFTYALNWEEGISAYDTAYQVIENDGTFEETLY